MKEQHFIEKDDTIRSIIQHGVQDEDTLKGVALAITVIQKMRNADVRPVRRGKWVNGYCSVCGCDISSLLNPVQNIQELIYCPICSAYMGGKNE